MPTSNSKDIFVTILSNVRKKNADAARAYRRLGDAAESSELKQDLEARAFITENDLISLDHCFERIGEKPVVIPFHLEDALVEDSVVSDFERTLTQLETSASRNLFILAKAAELVQLSITDYPILISGAEVTGHHVLGVLLETILAHKLALMERDRCLERDLIEGEIAKSGKLADLEAAA